MSHIQKPTTNTMYFMAYSEEGVQTIWHTKVGQETVSGQPSFISAESEDELLEMASEVDVTNYNELPEIGEWVALGYYSYQSDLIICIQAHNRTEHSPYDTPALFNVHRPDFAPWAQPAGAHDAYNTGAKVTYNDLKWTSTIDANVWAPDVYGWEEYND